MLLVSNTMLQIDRFQLHFGHVRSVYVHCLSSRQLAIMS